MSCPKCGGRDRRPIAPGLYECMQLVTFRGYRPGPGDAGASVDGMLAVMESRICGNRYQEAVTEGGGTGPSPSCACGMFSVATCSTCRRPLCGDHVRRVQGAIQCVDHVQSAKDAASEAEFQRVIDRIHEIGSQYTDAVHIALRLLVHEHHAPSVAKGRYFGTGEEGTPTGAARLSRLNAATRAALPDHPWFRINERTGWVQILDPGAMFTWLKSLDLFPVVRVAIERENPSRRKRFQPIVIGHIFALEIEATSVYQDRDSGRNVRDDGKFMLPDGTISSFQGDSLPEGWEKRREFARSPETSFRYVVELNDYRATNDGTYPHL